MTSRPMDLTVVIPMFNEAENVERTAQAVAAALEPSGLNWELLFVDDGSIDETARVAEQLSWRTPRLSVISYFPNQGRGKALRTGFEKAKGRIIATIDSDLSYDPKFILDLVKILSEKPDVGVAIGSPYMKGGRAEGVSHSRLWVSRLGNLLLGAAFSGNLHTLTGILRAYRREVLEAIELESNGKELYLEILSKVFALGYTVAEVPAVLRARQKGRSKFKLKKTAISHLLFCVYERPMMMFGPLGFLVLGLGVASGTLPFILGGIGLLSFGFLAVQLGILRKELYKIQRQHRLLAACVMKLGKEESQPVEKKLEVGEEV